MSTRNAPKHEDKYLNISYFQFIFVSFLTRVPDFNDAVGVQQTKLYKTNSHNMKSTYEK